MGKSLADVDWYRIASTRGTKHLNSVYDSEDNKIGECDYKPNAVVHTKDGEVRYSECEITFYEGDAL